MEDKWEFSRDFAQDAESNSWKEGRAKMRWISLICWLGICFAVAGVSGRWTASEIPGWYRTLARPSIAPPNWIFGPVWTLLYALMAVAAWQVWQSAPSPMRTWGLALFLVQLALNFAWSLIFFRYHAIGAALAEVIVLWVAIGATTLVFGRVTPYAAWMMAPYWAWVSFAAVLNAAFWRRNS
jgi:tryptophan-rich sensory protein